MGLFDMFMPKDINKGVEECAGTSGAVLLDVRTVQEYEDGRIPGAVNIPLQQIERAGKQIPDKETPLFVYCYSGARSSQAVSALKSMGYTRVRNIGGISEYTGTKEV